MSTIRPMVPHALVIWRLLIALAKAGRLGPGVALPDDPAVALAEQAEIGVYSDDPVARGLIEALGLDPDQILAAPTWRNV